jgi:hypothetical protein
MKLISGTCLEGGIVCHLSSEIALQRNPCVNHLLTFEIAIHVAYTHEQSFILSKMDDLVGYKEDMDMDEDG